jgi:hypothetical protein
MKRLILLCATAALLAGCGTIKPLKPGSAMMRSGLNAKGQPEFVSDMKQPENPAQSAAQNFERTTETELAIPALSKIAEVTVTKNDRGEAVTQERVITLAKPTMQKTRVSEKAGTVVGAAQKDMAREIGAKLSSLKGIVWLGAGLFVFGLATLAYPPLRAVIGSVTTSTALMAGGLALMFLPSLVVGNELLILGGVGLVVGAWFLAHRHGQLRGMIDANKNGIDDPLERTSGLAAGQHH